MVPGDIWSLGVWLGGKVPGGESLVKRLTYTRKNITFSQFCLWTVIMHYPWAGSWVHFR